MNGAAATWEQRMQALAGQEELLRNDARRQQQLAGIAASLEAFRERVQHGLANATFEQRRQLMLLLVDRVVVTNDEVEIRYVLPTSRESEHVRFCLLRKDYFNNPPSREHLKAARARRRLCVSPHPGSAAPPMLRDRQPPAEGLLEPVPQTPISGVGPHQLDGREQMLQTLQQEFGSSAIMEVGGLPAVLQQIALRINEKMALAAVDRLAAVVPPGAADLRGFH
jgi:site-specific DNA recombinase